jgi:hypothetical protein
MAREKDSEYCPPLLPDPKLIALRAAVARVANLSGAAEQQDQIMRDVEEISILSSDDSLNLLDSLLLRHVAACV